MPIFRSSLAVSAMALLAGGVALTATPASTSASTTHTRAAHTSVSMARPQDGPTDGIAIMPTVAVNLPAGVWTSTGLQVTLPRAGTYELDADVRGRLVGNPPVNTYITARLFDTTTGAEVLNSERLVYQLINENPGQAAAGGNQTAPISELVHVTGAATIQLQAVDQNAVGAAIVAQIYSDGNGYTSLRFVRVGP